LKGNAKKSFVFITLLGIVIFSICTIVPPAVAQTPEIEIPSSFSTPTQAAIAQTILARAEHMNEYVPTAEFIDFENGTTLTILDYQNGTKRYITETFLINEVLVSSSGSESLGLDIPTVQGPATEYLTKTQDVLMGFTVALPTLDWSLLIETVIKIPIFPDIEIEWLDLGVKFEFGFGLRLPVRIDLKYPEVMAIDHDYSLYAGITPLDWSASEYANAGLSGIAAQEFEFLCKFLFKIWFEVLGVDIINAEIDIDKSSNFATPLGDGMQFPIPGIPIDLSPLVEVIIGLPSGTVSSWLGLVLILEPIVTSNKITAEWGAAGDASGGNTITWNYPGHEVAFNVHASDYGPTNFADIELSDFKYYFTTFEIKFKLQVDFRGILDFIADINIYLFTLDLSWIMQQFVLYLGVHHDTVGHMDVSIFVEKFDVDLVITPSTVDIVPGDTGTYNIAVTNSGNVHDTFTLSVEGLPGNWLHGFSESEVTLDPGDFTDVELYIEPYRDWSTSTGDYSFSVTGTSQVAPSRDLTVTDTVFANAHILPFYEVDVVVIPATISTEPGGTGVYTIEVTNLGNVPDSFDISLSFIDFGDTYHAVPTEIQEMWTILNPTGLTLDPSDSGFASLSITVPSDWVGMEDAPYEFTATATDLSVSDSEKAVFMVQVTKESQTRYINLELEELTELVMNSDIHKGIKQSLLAKLGSATEKKEQALNYILEGRIQEANNMLKACQNIMQAYINQLEAQNDKHIPESLVIVWTTRAQTIVTDIDTTIAMV